ncbi:MAG: Phosphate-selective porin O and [Planctomycetota bacterium]|nr:MAG: Phosphate-selective porin O and [Planctomycetota bacterium]
MRHAARMLWHFVLLAGIAGAETVEERVKALEDRMALKDQPRGEAPTAAEGNRIGVYFKNGLHAKTQDGNFEIKIGGRVLVHYREYFANPERISIDNFSMREVKLDLKGKLWKDFGFRVEINGGGNSGFLLDDGYLSFERWTLLKIKVGQFKAPFSIEQTTSTLFIDLPERGPSDRLVPGYELGATVYGEIFEKILEYNLMIANGTLKAAENNSDKDMYARLQLRPFAKTGIDFIKGLHAGCSVNWGKRGIARGVLPYNYSVPSSQTVFVASGPRTAQVRFDEDRFRFCAELAWLAGPLGVKAEYIKTRDKYRFPGQPDSSGHSNHEAMFVTASWFITMEEKNWDRPNVKKPIFSGSGAFGALEVLARYSRFNVPGDLARDEIISKLASAQHVDEMAACINWYPNAHVRISVMYAYIEYNGRRNNPLVIGGKRIDHEDVLIVRMQIDF